MKSEEARSKAKERFKQQQELVKRWFDKHKVGTKDFKVGDLVLKWDHPMMREGSIPNSSSCGLALFRLW